MNINTKTKNEDECVCKLNKKFANQDCVNIFWLQSQDHRRESFNDFLF